MYILRSGIREYVRRHEVADTLRETSKSKRKEREGMSRKKAKMESEDGMIWGEYRSDAGVAKSSFLAEGVVSQRRVVGQSRIAFHSGLEWCVRDILKGVADLAVEVATAGREAMTWEVWEGNEAARELKVARVARREKPSKKELYQWKRLEEIDKEIANEEKKAAEKKQRAVARARKGKGAGANQPSILSKLKPATKSSKKSETPVTSPSRVGEEHGDGVHSREQDEGLSSKREQHGEGLHSTGRVAEVQSQDVCESNEDVCVPEIYEVSVAQLSSQNMNVSGVVAAEEIYEVSLAQLSSQNTNVSGVVAAEEYGMSVALLSKSSVCVEPSSRISKVQTNSTQKSQEIANTKASKIANPKGGKVGVLGMAGPSKGRGEQTNKQTDNYISFKKPIIIHPRVAKYHKIFEGNRDKSKSLQNMNNSPLKRKLHSSKNSYLIEVFSRDAQSNPEEESENVESPAKRTKYCRSGGVGGDMLED